MQPPPGDAANPADLDTIAAALESGRLRPGPGLASGLRALGVTDPAPALCLLAGAPKGDPAVLAWALRTLATERRAAADQAARSAQLVWSGQSEASSGLRDTRVVLDEVCARAERYVLVATYVVYDGRRSLAALARRMRELPALRVDLHIDMKASDLEGWAPRFSARHWPEGVRLPAVWYDPMTLERATGTSMHAKCVVADERHALVTSANFTEAAQERNLEVGTLLDNAPLARALSAQFRALRESGAHRRVTGT